MILVDSFKKSCPPLVEKNGKCIYRDQPNQASRGIQPNCLAMQSDQGSFDSAKFHYCWDVKADLGLRYLHMAFHISSCALAEPSSLRRLYLNNEAFMKTKLNLIHSYVTQGSGFNFSLSKGRA